MGVIKLKDGLYSVGVLNPGLRVFDIIMESKFGTSYNAYLITGKKNILIDTVQASFFDQYLRNIESVIPVSKIDYLVMNHTEPDHSGSVAKLLERNPNITVYSTFPAKKCLDGIVNHGFKSVVVKQGDRLDYGDGALEFIIAPLLHWPDSMFTWMPEKKVLFTCDFLGCHYCEPAMLDTEIHYPEKYQNEFEYYYRGIFGPFKPYVLSGLDKIADLPADLICPSHGPCLTDSIEKGKSLYRQWSTPQAKAKKTVAILYASAYGFTRTLAQAAREELGGNPGLDVKLVDMVFTPLAESAALVREADAVLVGSCTINRDAPKVVWDVLASVDAINTRGKPAGAFGSYGWSGEAVPMMKDRLQHLKYNFIGDGLRVNFKPTDADIAAMKSYAAEVVSHLK